MDKQKICRIRDVYRAIMSLESEFQTTYNLNINEAMLLCTLRDCSGMTSGEIAEQLSLTPSNTSKVITSVEKKALIRRKLDKVDKRQMHFALTPKGEALIETMHCSEIELPGILAHIIS
uniref:Winged helix DNA-binding protein n=5 Tax=unclassified Prevotella TaxID=2638335 RepID=A0AB33JM23_9BACT